MDRIWLGIDIGTQGVRVAAHASDGTLVAEGRASRQPRAPVPGAMVHEPERDWWAGAIEALRPVVASIPAGAIAGVGLAGLFPAFCLLDGRGEAISDGILYGDSRARNSISIVAELLDVTLTGDEVVPRLVWLQRQAPTTFRQARLVLGPAGYVGFRLTGEPSLDPHSAVRWGGIVNGSRDGWDPRALEITGIPREILPPIRRPHDVIGKVTPAAARATGLPVGVPVVAGTTDTLAQLIGDGLSRADEAMIYYGSSGTLLVCTTDLEAALTRPSTFAPGAPYRLAAYALNLGSFLERARHELFAGASYATLDAAAADVPPGADGLFVIPHVSGRLMPRQQPGARGAIIGLQLGHDRSHLWRAMLESFGYVLMEAQASLDRPVATVVAAGGGAASRVWRQILSDMTGWEQELAPPGGSARGAAFLAAYGMGELQRVADVREGWLAEWRSRHDAERTAPAEDAVRAYRTLFDVWRRYEAALGGLDLNLTDEDDQGADPMASGNGGGFDARVASE